MPRKVLFNEPSEDLDDSTMAIPKVKSILSTAVGLRRSLDTIQANCIHPMEAVVEDGKSNIFQCTMCGYTSYLNPARFRGGRIT